MEGTIVEDDIFKGTVAIADAWRDIYDRGIPDKKLVRLAIEYMECRDLLAYDIYNNTSTIPEDEDGSMIDVAVIYGEPRTSDVTSYSCSLCNSYLKYGDRMCEDCDYDICTTCINTGTHLDHQTVAGHKMFTFLGYYPYLVIDRGLVTPLN